MTTILVLCTGNSARSQMAQGYLQYFAGNLATVYSAGVAPHGINPLAIQVMAEDNLDISHHTSNYVNDYVNLPIDYVLTVCDNAREECPYFPATVQLIHHSFMDPSYMPEADRLTQFRVVRDQIKTYCRQFIKERIHQ